MRNVSIISLLAASLLPGQAPARAPVAKSTTVYINGHIYTPSGWAKAIAVTGTKIVAIGDAAVVARFQKPGATTVDLRGRTVFPGLADMHVHPMWAGQFASQCRIEPGATAKQLLATVAACATGKKPGEWVLGGPWQATSMGDTPITKEVLDAVSPANPVMLTDTSGHSRWANSKALAIGAITRETANPAGGIIERDARGEPTGVLRETASARLDAKLPPATREQNATSLKIALDVLLSQGVTSLTDALVKHEVLDAYDLLSDRSELKQHVLGCIVYKQAPDFDALIAQRQSFARSNFSPTCVKVFMDGVPTDSHTGAMVEPYADVHSSAPVKGMLQVPPGELNPAVTRWDKMGLVVKFHAAGDQATRSALDAIAAARAANGMSGARHMVAHNTFVTRDDLPRAKPLNATWEFSPYLWSPSPITVDIAKAVGPERMKRIWPIKEGFASGALVIAGSDWPVTPNGNPWVGIEMSVTRKAPGGGGESFAGAEAITLAQAVQMFTINAAIEVGAQRERGTLEIGKEADFIVLDRDPFAIEVTDIHNVTVLQTVIGGEEVYVKN